MPVSGLVVSLSDESQARVKTLDTIGREPRITVGVLEANRLAIVLNTVSREEDQQIWGWLGSLPGVLFVDVAFVGFEQHVDRLAEQVGQTTNITRCSSAAVAREGANDRP